MFVLLYGKFCFKVYQLSNLELKYCWDANDMFVFMPVIHYFLSPLLIAHGFIPVLLSNLLLMVAASYYHYLNFLGYDGKTRI